MSLQDDYYELRQYLKGTAYESALMNIWSAFCALETKEMYRTGEITPQQYTGWLEAQESLGAEFQKVLIDNLYDLYVKNEVEKDDD